MWFVHGIRILSVGVLPNAVYGVDRYENQSISIVFILKEKAGKVKGYFAAFRHKKITCISASDFLTFKIWSG
jgi:hypothetical protein